MINIKKRLLGTTDDKGLLFKLMVYIILIGIGYVYVYPIIYSVSLSFMSPEDLVDPSITWLPSSICLDNFNKALRVLEYPSALLNSVLWSVFPTVLQAISTAIIGYGLARFDFPAKKLWILFIIMSFLIPTQVTMIPRYVLYKTYGMAGTAMPALIPAIFGQGLKSTVFLLVYYQFFSSYPKAFDEAAEIDGAGKWKIFWRIGLPMAKPAILVAVLFSFIWYWNETNQASLYYGDAIQSLPVKLSRFVESYSRLYTATEGSTANRLNEAIRLAGTLLTIAPLIAVYVCLQKQFVESIERSGITGE